MVEPSRVPEYVTPDYVRNMEKPSDDIYCPLKANDLIRFGSYRIKDYGSNTVLM